MKVADAQLPPACLLRLGDGWARWSGGRLRRLAVALDRVLGLPLAEAREVLAAAEGGEIDPGSATLLAPVENQEVWAAGVTYRRSREARMEESTEADVYARVYEAARPELFFKAAGWRVVGPGGEVAVRGDSTWDVPEPELAVLFNSAGELFGYTCGNDLSSRSIEGENPLYLPQAKIYDLSCALGPGLVPAWDADLDAASVAMDIERDGRPVFEGRVALAELVRAPAELGAVLRSAYSLPVGCWLLTGTGVVPGAPYTAEAGDVVGIAVDGLGRLVNRVVRLPAGPAAAPPRRI